MYRKGNTGMLCRNTGQEQGTITGTGTKLKREILRAILVIPEFERGTEFRESRESMRSCDSGASRADEFRGGTSARVCDRGCDRFGTSRDLSAKSRECYES